MNKIIRKQQFSEKVFCIEVEAPLIARSCRPGNFIIVRVDNHSERVPYTIAKSDPVKGTLTMVIQEVGRSSTKLCQLNEATRLSISSAHLVPHPTLRTMVRLSVLVVVSVLPPSSLSSQP
ncbi:hypothetical protein [Prevotella scopos]|uniref:hypothetical protein n=1 Tax=Prevotella scopos TaxID=589437 RepID=UPI000AB16136